MKVLYLYAVPHTGSTFVRYRLLAEHPWISVPYTEVEMFRQGQIEEYTYQKGCNDIVLGQSLFKLLASLKKEGEEYIQILVHTQSYSFWPVLLYPPCDSKIIVSLRSPRSVLSSFYRRTAIPEAIGWPTMAQYMTQLHLIKTLPNVYVLPVDVLERVSVTERVVIMRRMYEEFLEVPFVEQIEQAVREWKRENTSLNPGGNNDSLPPGATERQLTDVEIASIDKRLILADVYNQLNLAGIECYNYESPTFDSRLQC